MKKPLLLVSFLLMNVGFLFAQKSVLVSDSTYFDYASKLAQQPYNWVNIIYNSNCLDTIDQQIIPSDQADSYQNIKSYYPNGSLYQIIYQAYDTVNQTFYNQRRTTYIYNASSLQINRTIENWNGTNWSPGGIGNTYYNAMGKDSFYIYKEWNAIQQVYVNNLEIINNYDSIGRMTGYLQQSWNINTGMWEPQFGTNYVFDANGYERSFTYSNVNYMTGIYGIDFQQVTYVNSIGLTDSSYTVDNQVYFQDSIRNYNTYYPASSIVQQTITYSYDDNRAFVNGSVSNFFHDTVGSRQIDSTITKNFLSTPDNTDEGGGIRISYRDSANYIVSDSTVDKYYPTIPENATVEFTFKTLEEYNEFHQQTRLITSSNDSISPYGSYYEVDSHYTICTSSVLPVTLLNFTGSQKNKDAVLHWQTSNEINTSYFTVQRSIDGIHFTNIGKVMASGNSSTLKDYSYTDANITLLNSNKLFYRLAEQDNNGKSTFSNTVELFISEGKLSVTISPNPVQNAIVIYSPVAISNAIIKVVDMNGHILYSTQKNMIAGDKVIVDASQLAKGMYIVTIQSQSDKKLFKIIK